MNDRQISATLRGMTGPELRAEYRAATTPDAVFDVVAQRIRFACEREMKRRGINFRIYSA